MAVHFVVRLNKYDEEAMTGYQTPTAASIQQYGGRYITASNTLTNLEGDVGCERLVILEFPNKSSALDWYNSSAYAPLLKQRATATESIFTLVE